MTDTDGDARDGVYSAVLSALNAAIVIGGDPTCPPHLAEAGPHAAASVLTDAIETLIDEKVAAALAGHRENDPHSYGEDPV